LFRDAVSAIGGLLWNAVLAIGSVLLEHAELLLGFALAFVATHYRDWLRKRADERKLARALVYQIRRALRNLEELQEALTRERVIYSSSFSDSLWKQSERDVADLSADVYVYSDAFFAQLRMTDFMRDEFRRFHEKVLAAPGNKVAIASRSQCGLTLRACVSKAIEYGKEALKGLKPYADSSAFTATLPHHFSTEEEAQSL